MGAFGAPAPALAGTGEKASPLPGVHILARTTAAAAAAEGGFYHAPAGVTLYAPACTDHSPPSLECLANIVLPCVAFATVPGPQ